MFTRVLLLGLSLLLFIPSSIASAGTIVVQADAEVSERTIWLSDIATVQGEEDVLDLIKRMSRVNLGPSPKPGGERTLSQGTIKTRVRAALGDVEVILPKKVVVHRRSGVIAQDDLEDAIETWALDVLINDLNMPDANLHVIGLSRGSIFVAPDFTGFDVHGDLSRLPAGSVAINILVHSPGGKVDRFPMTARLKVEAPVLVLAHNVHRGKSIKSKDLKTELRDLSRGAKPLFEPSMVVGLNATRELKAGALLLTGDVDFPPDINRGDPITLMVRSGALKVSVPGEAKADGRVGELIPVYCPTTRRSLRGFVLASGIVEIPYHSTLGQ